LSRLIDTTTLPSEIEWEYTIGNINKTALRENFDGCKTERPHHRRLCLATCGWGKSALELDEQLKELEGKGEFTKAAAWALYENVPKRAVEILKRGGKDLLFIALALNLQLQGAKGIEKEDWDDSFKQHPQMKNDRYLRAICAFISTGNWKSITEDASLPLRDRVGVAIRNFPDEELSEWLEAHMTEAIETGDIDGIVLAGITDRMVGIFAQYHEKFGDFQTATLIISHGAPLYISDYRTLIWREEYRNHLNVNKLHIDRCKFDVRTTKMSRQRDGTTIIKPPPRQITLRCVRCDSEITNDKHNTTNPPSQRIPTSVSAAQEQRNPLYPSGVHAGISCPRCGRHLGRCSVCLQTLGLPRIDRQDLSTSAQELMKNFMAFCLKCDHASHADHYGAWFERHNECPVSDCHCPCNMSDLRIKKEQEARKKADQEEKRREAGSG
jgi:WD repeat-containing protein mio